MGYQGPATFLDLCVRHAEAALLAVGHDKDSRDAARLEAQSAIFNLVQHLAPAIGDVTGAQIGDRRAAWVRTLRFIRDAFLFPQLDALIVALEELNRGVTSSDLVAAAGGQRGGLSGTSELQLMAYAVEAATELHRRCKYNDEWEKELKESECSRATIAKYRKLVAAGPQELHPRSNYVLSWGDEAPELLLQKVVWRLQDMRKKPRKVRDVTT